MTTGFPSRFESLTTIREYLLSVSQTDPYCTHTENGARWDLIRPVRGNRMIVQGYWDGAEADGDFEIEFEHDGELLHFHVSSPYAEVMPIATRHIVPQLRSVMIYGPRRAALRF